jgi:hypothetical protein
MHVDSKHVPDYTASHPKDSNICSHSRENLKCCMQTASAFQKWRFDFGNEE